MAPEPVSSENIPIAPFASTSTTPTPNPFQPETPSTTPEIPATQEDIGLKEKIDKINQQTELIDQKINEIKSELCSSGETYQFCEGVNIPPEATLRGKEVLFG